MYLVKIGTSAKYPKNFLFLEVSFSFPVFLFSFITSVFRWCKNISGWFPPQKVSGPSIINPFTEVIHKWHKKFSLWRLFCVTQTSL